MNKKYLMFGVMAMLAVTLVSAVLVDYLSNTETVAVNVESPFEIRSLEFGQVLPVFDNLSQGSLIAKEGVVGNDIYEVTFGFKSLSNRPMDVIESYTIGGEGTTCEDFSDISWFTCTNDCTEWKDLQTLDLTDEAQCDDSSGRIIINAPNDYDDGETNVNKIVLTLQPNAVGNYSISAQVKPVPVEVVI